MPTARSGLAAATGPDGKVYALGGVNSAGSLDTVEVYDPDTGAWSRRAPLPPELGGRGATHPRFPLPS